MALSEQNQISLSALRRPDTEHTEDSLCSSVLLVGLEGNALNGTLGSYGGFSSPLTAISTWLLQLLLNRCSQDSVLWRRTGVLFTFEHGWPISAGWKGSGSFLRVSLVRWGETGRMAATVLFSVFPQTSWVYTVSWGLTLSSSKRMRKRQGMGAVAVIRDGGYHF